MTVNGKRAVESSFFLIFLIILPSAVFSFRIVDEKQSLSSVFLSNKLKSRNFFEVYEADDMIAYSLTKPRESKCEELEDYLIRSEQLIADFTQTLLAIENIPPILKEIRAQLEIIEKYTYDDLEGGYLLAQEPANSTTGLVEKRSQIAKEDSNIQKLKKLMVFLPESTRAFIESLESKMLYLEQNDSEDLPDLVEDLNDLVDEMEEDVDEKEKKYSALKEGLINKRDEANGLLKVQSCE